MPDTAIFDHYEVLTRDDGSLFELGRGAMGITYKAFDTSLRIPVALKVINATYLNSEVARQRFVREARSAAQLRHRHVASVFHLGTEGDTWFYAMEFIDGETLDALIKHHGPLTPVVALTITGQVARALNAAAQHGLVHRDIKPANLMLVKEDDELVAKVIDFGLAKAAVPGEGEDAATLSMGGFVGTPHFASPEQLEEKEIDSRSDIYSLGVTLWYMLAGQAPFAGSMAQVMSQHLTKPPPFEKLDKLSPVVAEVLRKMLAKDPADRYQTPAELRKSVEAALETLGHAPSATVAPVEAMAAPHEDFATLLQDSAGRAGLGSFETNTTIANRYRVARSCGETNAGKVFRAYDTQRKAEVRLIVLHPDALNDAVALTGLEHEVERLLPVQHPNLIGVLGFETVDRGSFLVLEWTEGFSLLDLLKARRELDADEALQILAQAAEGADHAIGLGLNGLEFGLHQIQIHFPEPIERETLLHSPLKNWPAFAVKLYPLGAAREISAGQTWAGAQTMVACGDASKPGEVDARPQYVQALAAVTYELLGGSLSPLALRGAGGPTARYTPLSTLSEEGNEVLRRALDCGRSYPTVREFSAALSQLDGLQVRHHEPKPASVPARAVTVAPVRAATVAPVRTPTVAPVRAAAVVPTPLVAPVPVPAPAPAAFVPTRQKGTPVVLIGILAAFIVTIVAVVYFFRPSGPKPQDVGGPSTHLASNDNPSTPAAGDSNSPSNPPSPDNPPIPTPIPVTPIAITPIPVTPIPATPVPGPTKQDMLRTAVNAAQELEDGGKYNESLHAWLEVAKNYPESPVGKNHLETMLGHLRDRPSPITMEEFNEMRPLITEAAQLDILAGMMLLADNVRKQEPETAFHWYSVAADKGLAPAMTQLGLLLSNNVLPDTPDLPKAVHWFQAAAEKGDAPAKMALGDCYQFGKGVDKDETKALDYFQQAADAGDLRAINRLGDCYVRGIGGKADLPEAFRLFTKAADLGSLEALGNLGVLYMNGDTPDHKVDGKKAVEIWKKGADNHNAFCMWLYARSLENGLGITKSPLQARGMYQKAAEAGDKRAIEWCRKNFVPFHAAAD